MESEKFDLVFSGQLLPRQNIADVKANMAALFNVSEGQINTLFSGKTVVLKRSLDLAAANRYRIALKKAGARVELVKVSRTAGSEPERSKAVEQGIANNLNNASRTAETRKTELPAKPKPVNAGLTLASLGANLSDKPQNSIAPVSAPDFDLLAVGSDLLAKSERAQVAVRQIDTSALSLRENQGNLIDSDEWQADLPLIIADLEVDLMPPGSDLITADERQPEVEASITDLNVDLAPLGSRLQPEIKQTSEAPNVDHIVLMDKSAGFR
jgi:hypothetical protein